MYFLFPFVCKFTPDHGLPTYKPVYEFMASRYLLGRGGERPGVTYGTWRNGDCKTELWHCCCCRCRCNQYIYIYLTMRSPRTMEEMDCDAFIITWNQREGRRRRRRRRKAKHICVYLPTYVRRMTRWCLYCLPTTVFKAVEETKGCVFVYMYLCMYVCVYITCYSYGSLILIYICNILSIIRFLVLL